MHNDKNVFPDHDQFIFSFLTELTEPPLLRAAHGFTSAETKAAWRLRERVLCAGINNYKSASQFVL